MQWRDVCDRYHFSSGRKINQAAIVRQHMQKTLETIANRHGRQLGIDIPAHQGEDWEDSEDRRRKKQKAGKDVSGIALTRQQRRQWQTMTQPQ